MWVLTLRQEHVLQMFENKRTKNVFGSKRDDV
jgi:hypothetical protein